MQMYSRGMKVPLTGLSLAERNLSLVWLSVCNWLRWLCCSVFIRHLAQVSKCVCLCLVLSPNNKF